MIYVALQRSRTAKEAIQVMTDLVKEYGYYSSGDKEANERYAKDIYDKFNERLGDQNGEAAIQLKETLNQALKEFKEMNDTLE